MSYAVTARWVAKEGEADAVARALEAMAAPSRGEEGCRVYQPHRSVEDSNSFLIYEQYADEAAFRAHADSEHFQRYVIGDALGRLADRQREFYETLDF